MGSGDPRPASEATRLGSYEILRKIARGGMAELFLARTHGPEGFEKLVVLKKILPSFAENPKFVRLFLDEARLAATLDHPHIAHVYDMGKVEGHYFFTMEYVHGQDMRSALRRTARLDDKFPIDHTVQIVHAVAAALHYAHERRTADGKLLDIVHRDVSPSNVLISYDGAIKLVDFGVAKAATSSVKTRTGTLKGKIAYMSPEQAKGSPIDRRSDVFSLGIVLWEMLTTTRLFKADNDLATIQLIINSRPQPPSELRPECPPELERIVLKALSADLEARYQTAEELQVDLQEFAREAKLKQSSVGLRSHMQVLFADEFNAWKSAQASGVAIHDHLTYVGANEMTTPVSENELSFMSEGEVEPGDHDDDEDDDSEALEPRQGVVTSTTNMRPGTVGPQQPSIVVARQGTGEQPQLYSVEEPPTVRFPVGEPPPTVRLRTGEQPQISRTSSQNFGPAPHTTPSSGTPMPIGHQPSNSMHAPMRAPTIPPGHGQMHLPDAQSAFPIAPREWHDTRSPQHELLVQQRIQRWLIGGLISIAVIVVIILGAAGGTAPPANAVVDMKPEPVTRQPENVGGGIGSATEEVKQPEVKQPDVKPEVKQPDAVPEVKQPEVKQPEVKQPEVKQPEVKQPDAVKTKVVPKPDATKTAPKADATKLKPKPADKPKHAGSAYDPNSALPPP